MPNLQVWRENEANYVLQTFWLLFVYIVRLGKFTWSFFKRWRRTANLQVVHEQMSGKPAFRMKMAKLDNSIQRKYADQIWQSTLIQFHTFSIPHKNIFA